MNARHDISYNENIDFNQDEYDDYAKLVVACDKVAKTTYLSDVKTEAPTMLKKMRGLLHPKIKSEVDYKEAAKDVSNILSMLRMKTAAGKRAFIPDTEDCDLCYNAVKILCHATVEAGLIPDESCKEFGEKTGSHVYNELHEIIGERDKNCLPFVNMCLCTWLEPLHDDADI